MAVYSQLTLVELAKRLDPKGELAAICECLAEDNEILQDAVWLQANDVFSHKIVRRSALPTGSWRKLNEGVATETSQTVEVIEQLGLLETYAECDKDLADAAPNPTQFRMDEAKAFIEGMSQTLAETLIYGSIAVTPEKIKGIGTRLNALAATANVIGAGGTGSDVTSIYIIQWGPRKTYLVYPRGSESLGVSHKDLGECTLGTSALYQGYRDHFQVKVGLVVEHPRSIARIANIESSGTSNIFDEDDLITLLNRMPMSGAGASIYVNSTVKSQMEIMLKDKTNVNYTADAGEGLAGVPVLKFRGNPVRKVDQILLTESAIS
jgi:hypothetical protein